MNKILLQFARLAGLLAFTAVTAFAGKADPINAKGREKLALRGYDAVAYFTDGKPVKGDAQFTHAWMGATWRFASAEHRDQFAAAPETYAPHFGGYCAWAVSQGYVADADPEAWDIVEGRLYVNYNKDVQKKWRAERAALIGKAEQNWPNLIEAPKKN